MFSQLMANGMAFFLILPVLYLIIVVDPSSRAVAFVHSTTSSSLIVDTPRRRDIFYTILQSTNNNNVETTKTATPSSTTSVNTNDKTFRPNSLAFVGVRYRARVAYDGTYFNGWQTQNPVPEIKTKKHDDTLSDNITTKKYKHKRKKSIRTVQGELESVLSTRFNQIIRVLGSGRTDTGVHARATAIHFDLPSKLSEQEVSTLEHSLNQMLPNDIVLWNLELTPRHILIRNEQTGEIIQQKSHVIVDSRGKLYTYRFTTKPYVDPLQRFTYAHFYHKEFDVCIFEKVLQHFVGTHDFRAFAGAVEANEKKRNGGRPLTTLRTINTIKFIDEGERNFRVDIYLEGALYKMVRNIIGTAMDVAIGKMTEDQLLTLIHQNTTERNDGSRGSTDDAGDSLFTRDDNSALPAPPQGLTLEYVFYDDFD